MAAKQISNKLATRLAILLTLALAPLGLIAVYSEYAGWQARKQTSDTMLILRTIDSVTGQRALLESAMQSARALTTQVLDTLDDTAACSEMLADFVSAARLFSFAGFIEIDGPMRCVSSGEARNLGGLEGFDRAMAEPLPYFTFQQTGLVTGEAVIVASWPVYHDNQQLGRLTISISRTMLDLLSTNPDPDIAPKTAVLLNHRGEVLTGSGLSNGAALLPTPARMQALISQQSGVYRAVGEDGKERVVTVAQLAPSQLYVLGTWEAVPERRGFSPDIARFGFPVMMWIASVGVVMMSIHYLVVRHLRQINKQLRRFALGNREDFQRLPESAPTELQEIDSTFSKMARLIARDEHELEEALQEKTVLLKEVHHRVKNNLQLIASILNLQIRRLKHPDARLILKGVQSRVRALASIHRMLYEETRVSNIDATSFLDRIMQDTRALASPGNQGLDIECQFDPVSLPAEKIIPAALLFSEALTNAIKYATPSAGSHAPKVTCGIRAKDGMAELWVRNSLAEPAPDAAREGLGRELMTAFAAQIGAELDVGGVSDSAGHGWEMYLRLPDAGLNPADTTEGRAL
ncbi:MAG: sensor histidine kinase [Roseinatronobacter sp.]